MLLMAGLAVASRAQTVNINCGGVAFTATDGTQWAADQNYSGGDLLYTGSAIANAAVQDLNLYRSGRAGLYTDFSYQIPVPDGAYTVTLGFAEIQYSAAGQRVFNVILNGNKVLSNFDILTHAARLTPFMQQFPVTVTNGAVQIAVNGVVNRGLVNAIRVAPASGGSGETSAPPPASPALSLGANALSFSGTAGGASPAAKSVAVTNSGSGTLSWSAGSNSNWLTVSPSTGSGAGTIAIQPNLSGLSAGTYNGTLTVSAAGASGSPATVAVTLTVAANPPPPISSLPSININCGGIAMTTSDGTQWSADVNFANGQVYYASSGIANTSAEDYHLYRSAREGLYTDFTYSIPVPNGAYNVALRFAETRYSTRGQRTFSVVMNGSTVLNTFDILANVPPNTPLLQQFPVTVTNGQIQLAFNGVVNKALVNAIQVTPAVAGTVIPPSLNLGGASLSFSGTEGGSMPTAQAVNVINAGGSTLNWTASSSANWLRVSPAYGTAPASISVQPDLSGLAAGSYSGTVTVDAAGAANAPKTVSVSLSVTAANPPVLTLSCSTVAFSSTAGGANPASQTVNISNTGGGTLNWTASSNQSPLKVSPAQGTNSGTLTVTVDLDGVPAGSYSGAITVNAGTAGTKTINVSATVSPATTSTNGTTGTPGGASTTAPPPTTSGNSWYVTTSGSSSGNGSMSSPWDIQTALSGPASVKPGDTIWIRGGRYGGGASSSVISSRLVGTATAPIIVRAWPGERATIDAWLHVGCCDGANNPAYGSYTWFWGLEFASYNTDRTSGTSGPPEWARMANHAATDAWGDGTKYINCIFHDTSGGVSVWVPKNAEVYGNIIYNVGGYGTDRGHGHHLYLQNNAPSVMNVSDNIAFNNFDEGVQAYGSSDAAVQNIHFYGNAIFNSGLLYGNLVDNFTIGGGATGPDGIILDSNYTYHTPSRNLGRNELGFLWTPTAGTAVLTNNYFVGGSEAIDIERWHNLTFQNNTMYTASGQQSWLIYTSDEHPASYNDANNRYYGVNQFWVFPNCGSWPCPSQQTVNFSQWQAMGLDQGSTLAPGAPTGIWTFVRPNQYEPGRANIVIYDWDLAPFVTVDLSKSGIKVGDQYQIRDAQNWYHGAVVSGTYDGSPVTIPMSGLTVAQPVGSVPYPPSHTAPQFGVFVLLSGTALPNTY